MRPWPCCVLAEHIDQHAKQSLFSGESMRSRIREASKQTDEVRCQTRIARHGPHDLDLTAKFLRDFTAHDMRVEINHPPSTSIAGQRGAVVNFAWIHHDHIPGGGLYGANTAARALRAKSYYSNTELIVEMAGEMMI